MIGGLQDYIQQGMADWDIPGLSISIVKDDEIIFAEGFGLREVGKKDPVDEHTIFAVASNTKAFTATALGLLVQENKIAWDDPVTKHLPWFQMYDPYVTREITVRDLLCHRSGLATWGGDFLAYGSRKSREDLIHLVRYIPPSFSFRSSFGYSNMMFIAAGQIITAVTGSSWDDFVKERFLDPLSMTRSNTSTSELPLLKNVAVPHENITGALSPLPYRNVDNHGPTGGINSTAWDMAQWLRLQLGKGTIGENRLVDEVIIEETRIPHTPIQILPAVQKINPYSRFLVYGLGIGLMDFRGCLLATHQGGLDGMISKLSFLPEENLGIVILTNKCPNSFTFALSYHVIDRYLGLPFRDWNQLYLDYVQELDAQKAAQNQRLIDSRREDTHPSLSLDEYAGKYTNQLYGDVFIGMKDDKLFLQLSDHPGITGEFEHWHFDTFLCRWSDPVFDQSLVPFLLNIRGKVEKFKVKIREDWIDPLEYEFQKVPDKDNLSD